MAHAMRTKTAVKIAAEVPPVPKDVLASAIVRISESLEKLRKSGVNRAAIVALVKDDIGVPKSTINAVLDSLEHLRRNYT